MKTGSRFAHILEKGSRKFILMVTYWLTAASHLHANQHHVTQLLCWWCRHR